MKKIDSCIIEYIELSTTGVLINLHRKVCDDMDDGITLANELRDIKHDNGERKYVSINVWGISVRSREWIFINWWE